MSAVVTPHGQTAKTAADRLHDWAFGCVGVGFAIGAVGGGIAVAIRALRWAVAP